MYESIFDYRSPFTYSSAVPSFQFNEERYGNYQSLKDGSVREPLISRILRLVISFLCYFIIICTLPVSCFLCIKKVPALERMVVFRLGKMQKVKGPGYIVILPCVDHWMKVDLRPQTYQIPKQQLITSDGAIVELGANLHYQIIDVVKSVLQVSQLERLAKQLADQCLTTATSRRDQEDLERHLLKLEIDIQTMLNKTTIAWGLEVTQVDVGPVIILKAAENQNAALGKLMSTLSSAMNPNKAENPQTQTKELPVAEETGLELEAIVNQINDMLSVKSNQSGLDHCPEGVLKMVVSNVEEVLMIRIKDGNGRAYTAISNHLSNADVCVNLSMPVLQELVNGNVTPLQAYAAGSVSATGDLMLLKSIGDVFA